MVIPYVLCYISTVTILTIPPNLIRKGELVLIPRSEYEELLKLKRAIREFQPTRAQKRDLEASRRDFAKGRYVGLEQLRDEMARLHP